jgi:NAD(P)-dependent dehydrogenase (short-subunit alcohol dehydrogenase family)
MPACFLCMEENWDNRYSLGEIKMTKWSTHQMPDQNNRIAIVTGANSGLGYETSRALAEKSVIVIMACRNLQKGQTALDKIQFQHPNATLELMMLDVSSLDSVRQFVATFREKYDRLDMLINNAGVMMIPERWETVDGFEMQFGTNHLGHFALTGLLLDIILYTGDARIVNVSSVAHQRGRINFDDLNAQQSYNPNSAYAQSKLANLLFTYELQRRLEKSGSSVIATAAHPGWTATNLQRHSGFFRFLNPILGQGTDMGALPTLYAATASEVEGGDFYGPGGFMGMHGYPKKVESSERSHDRDVAAKLWDVSEQLTGVTYEFGRSVT